MNRTKIPKTEDMGMVGPCWMEIQGTIHPMLTCPENHRAILRDHSIKADGEVNASILCPECGWHVWGILSDWEGGPIEPGRE